MLYGNESENELLPKERVIKLVQRLKLDGMELIMELPSTDNSLNRTKFPIVLGIEPTRPLLDRLNRVTKPRLQVTYAQLQIDISGTFGVPQRQPVTNKSPAFGMDTVMSHSACTSGLNVGDTVGAYVGESVGDTVGLELGCEVGQPLG
jgi:hypothetical protein